MAKNKKTNEIKPPYQDAVSVLLKKKNIAYDTWSKEVINDICVAVLQSENIEWRNRILEQESIRLIAASITEEQEENKEKNFVQSTVEGSGLNTKLNN